MNDRSFNSNIIKEENINVNEADKPLKLSQLDYIRKEPDQEVPNFQNINQINNEFRTITFNLNDPQKEIKELNEMKDDAENKNVIDPKIKEGKDNIKSNSSLNIEKTSSTENFGLFKMNESFEKERKIIQNRLHFHSSEFYESDVK